MIALGLILALASALAINLGYYGQHHAASAMPALTLRRPVHSLLLLFRNLRWLASMLAGLVGWVLYVVAVAIAPLSLVQATAAGGIGVLAILSGRASGRRPRREVVGVALTIAGLAILAASIVGTHPSSHAGSWPALTAWTLTSLAVAGLAAGYGMRHRRGAALGIAAGVLYAGGDTLTKAVFGGGSGHLLLPPVVLALHGLAFVALQLGFQRGTPLETAGFATVLTSALPIAAGNILFAEPLGAGSAGVLRLASYVMLLGATAILAFAPHEEPRAEGDLKDTPVPAPLLEAARP